MKIAAVGGGGVIYEGKGKDAFFSQVLNVLILQWRSSDTTGSTDVSIYTLFVFVFVRAKKRK